ncbi:MAG: SRPBCC family protein [Flavobacteriales bacterium]
MDKYGTITAPNTIRFERLLPGPIERVWAYLTEPEKRAKWLASGVMDLHTGGDMTLNWMHSNLDTLPETAPEEHAKGHTMQAKITRCEPPHLLGFTWGARAEALSEVVFELSMRGNDVLLVLTHHRLPNQKDLLGVSGGWHAHLDVLVEHLHGRTSPGFWASHAALNAEYKQRVGQA